ncbi:MAG TPA: queuosine salvage family protein [Planctomycetota bacterium]|nr:queuosine salvage family protein [Planctomycetota bacterium]
MGDVFDAIRSACRDVAQGARHVRLVEPRLAALADALPDPREAPGPEPAHHWLGHGEGTAVFMLLLDAVNFGSGWSAHLRKPEGLSTYYTTASALTRWFEREGVPTPARVLALGPAELGEIFGQMGRPAGHPVHELLALWARSLHELAELVRRDFGGEWLGPVRAAEGRAARLVERLGALPAWHDVAAWRGRQVPFFKRAQIACADLHLAAQGAWWGRFDDLPRLTLFADNLVPHVLRVEGVLEYEPALAARIAAGTELPAGSEGEVEIRACGLHAVELLVARLAATGRPATALQLDGLLWHRGQSPSVKAVPRHRTRSSFY